MSAAACSRVRRARWRAASLANLWSRQHEFTGSSVSRQQPIQQPGGVYVRIGDSVRVAKGRQILNKKAKKAKTAGGGPDQGNSARTDRRRPLAMRKLAQQLDETLVAMAAKSEQGWNTECRFETPKVDRLKRLKKSSRRHGAPRISGA